MSAKGGSDSTTGLMRPAIRMNVRPAGRFSTGRCEVVQSLLSLVQLSLPCVEAFGERGELGAEIRAQLEPHAVVSVSGAVDVAFDGCGGQAGVDHGLDLRDADDVL